MKRVIIDYGYLNTYNQFIKTQTKESDYPDDINYAKIEAGLGDYTRTFSATFQQRTKKGNSHMYYSRFKNTFARINIQKDNLKQTSLF